MAREAAARAGQLRRKRLLWATALAVGTAVFAADLLSPLQGAVAVLYVIVVLLVAHVSNGRTVLATGLVCALLAVVAFVAGHLHDPFDAAYVRFAVSLVAIAAATLLSMEQRRADTERRRSERRFRTIFHAAGFATWESDWSASRRHMLATLPAGADPRAWLAEHVEVVREIAAKAVIREANQATVELFEASSREEIIGGNVAGRILPGTEQWLGELLAEMASGAEMVEKELRYATLRGRPIDVVLRVTLFPEGEPWSRVLVMALDVTERNEARAKLEQTSAELAHAARVSTLGQLAASIAHEVNQPLSAIITYGKSGKRWLSREAPDLAETANCLDHIVANGSRAADVIARVRSLARKSAPETEPLALADLIGEAVALVEREARAAGVALILSGEEDVPLVVGDKVQVQQVLVNLVMNGIQAMREVEGRPRELCILLAAADGMVRVAVEDCGTGIEGDPARIFDPFFTTKSDGMGMGLSICRSIIEAQGGRISAANNPGHGATVTFTLPVHAAAQTPAHTSV